jgi:hypothetical protein
MQNWPSPSSFKCHVHLGDLAGHHVVAGDQLVALEF